jgi:class 3 adenylate cyclase
MSGDEATLLRELLAMHEDVDDLIERSLQSRHGLAQFTAVMMPMVCERLGATGMMLQTFGESLALETFRHPRDLAASDLAGVEEKTGDGSQGHVTLKNGSKTIIAQRLDVAGEWFGRAAVVFDRADVDGERVARLLDAACEELDNFLYAIRAARQKHTVMMQLADALRSRVLADGLQQAVSALVKAIPMERMLLVFVADEQSSSTLHVELFDGEKATVDTFKRRVDPRILEEGREYLRGKNNALLERFGFTSAQEEVLINGVTHSVIVGKVLVTSSAGAFNTWDRELLAGFAGFVRQRIVDFNKEWRRLAASFCSDDVARLVQSDDYEQRYLTPRDEQVGILYTDIAGFTRISEQVLKKPSEVAKLVEAWSEQAVDLVWKHGGVFDKMVGDCIIALFGPPFYESPKGERLQAAIRCAVDIRDMTAALPKVPGFELLREAGLGVSTGVNLASLMVGTFGKNSNFTGFSSGMNNTARLQGCAKKDEILVMEEAIGDLPKGHEFQFGEPRDAAVKNVAVPLRFRALVR